MMENFFRAVVLFVDCARQDCEVPGYFGMRLHPTWAELREVVREEPNGPTEVWFARIPTEPGFIPDPRQPAVLENGLSWLGTYPGTSLNYTRLIENPDLVTTLDQTIDPEKLPWWEVLG